MTTICSELRSRPSFATCSSSPIIIVGTIEAEVQPSASIVREIRAGSKVTAGICAEPVAIEPSVDITQPPQWK